MASEPEMMHDQTHSESRPESQRARGAKSLKAQVGAEVTGRPTVGYLHNHSQTDPQSKSA
jgi:hypothetical protein